MGTIGSSRLHSQSKQLLILLICKSHFSREILEEYILHNLSKKIKLNIVYFDSPGSVKNDTVPVSEKRYTIRSLEPHTHYTVTLTSRTESGQTNSVTLSMITPQSGMFSFCFVCSVMKVVKLFFLIFTVPKYSYSY